MNKPTVFHLIFIFLHIFLTTTNSVTVAQLSSFPEWKTNYQNLKTLTINEDLHTYYYEQTLDHFNFMPGSYKTFKQRYFVNFKYWGGANSSAPILAYLGGEDDIVYSLDFMTDNATYFKALLVYIEHRYYGKSVPFDAYNDSTVGYLNSAQALADYEAVLQHLKHTLHAEKSPVIVVGGSYAGMLAAWFRLKYPHITIGALASSAPLLYFDRITPENAYYDVVTKDFRETSETCYEFIRNSWSEIDQVASQPNGLSILSRIFHTCHPLEQSAELKDYLSSMYLSAAQYDVTAVTDICEGIDAATFGGDILSRIYGGVVAVYGNSTCNIYTEAETFNRWGWQTCTEMVMPIGIGNSSMFQSKPFNFTSFAEQCEKDFGVSPRPHWITSYYGGHDIKLVLKKFGSNIIFSNGLRDPYSSGGVLNNLSESLVALPTVNGTHCQDLLPANESDPAWLVHQRKKEVEIIQSWIKLYYADLG